jgi:hypothetical protein
MNKQSFAAQMIIASMLHSTPKAGMRRSGLYNLSAESRERPPPRLVRKKIINTEMLSAYEWRHELANVYGVLDLLVYSGDTSAKPIVTRGTSALICRGSAPQLGHASCSAHSSEFYSLWSAL